MNWFEIFQWPTVRFLIFQKALNCIHPYNIAKLWHKNTELQIYLWFCELNSYDTKTWMSWCRCSPHVLSVQSNINTDCKQVCRGTTRPIMDGKNWLQNHVNLNRVQLVTWCKHGPDSDLPFSSMCATSQLNIVHCMQHWQLLYRCLFSTKSWL